MDANQAMDGGRPNINAVNQLELLDEDWLSISPQRDDLKLLCEQNVSTHWSRSTCRLITQCQYAKDDLLKLLLVPVLTL